MSDQTIEDAQEDLNLAIEAYAVWYGSTDYTSHIGDARRSDVRNATEALISAVRQEAGAAALRQPEQEKEKEDHARSDQPQLRAGESDPRVDLRGSSRPSRFHFHSNDCYGMGPGDTEVLICGLKTEADMDWADDNKLHTCPICGPECRC